MQSFVFVENDLILMQQNEVKIIILLDILDTLFVKFGDHAETIEYMLEKLMISFTNLRKFTLPPKDNHFELGKIMHLYAKLNTCGGEVCISDIFVKFILILILISSPTMSARGTIQSSTLDSPKPITLLSISFSSGVNSLEELSEVFIRLLKSLGFSLLIEPNNFILLNILI